MWRNKNDTQIYDVQLHDDNHTETIKIRKFTNPSPCYCGPDTTVEEILLLRHRDMKRGQLEALLKHTSIIKKRKTNK